MTPITGRNFHLLRWLTRHFDRLELLDWFAKRGMPHPVLQRLVRERLAMPAAAPGALVGPGERPALEPALEAAWRILAFPAIRTSLDVEEFPGQVDWLKEAADDRLVQQNLLRQFKPVMRVRPGSSHRALRAALSAHGGTTEPMSLSDCLDVEVSPAAGLQTRVLKEQIDNHPDRAALLAALADDFTSALKECLELFAVPGEASRSKDPGLFDRRSIAPHEQDRHREEWTVLIDMARDSMACLRQADPGQADALLARWRAMPYPIFHRLVLNEFRERL